MNFNRINKLINDFMLNDPFFNYENNFFKNYTKKTYKSDDGSFVFTVVSNKKDFEEKNEILNLKYELDLAVENQDFEKAVELRDQIKNLEKNKEEINSLNLELNECIENQDFETAIKLRDRIKSLR